MTTSSNTSWQLTESAIVYSAYRKIGFMGEGQTLSDAAYANGVEALNGVIALLNTDGMPLWKRTKQVLIPSATNQIYTITDAIKVAQVSLYDILGGTLYDLREKSLYDFQRLPVDGPGIPVHYTYQPKIQDGTLSIWPQSSDSTSVTTKQIWVTYQKEFDGFFSVGDTPDFPAYWTMAIIYLLAVALAPETGVPLQDRQTLIGEAKMYKEMASSYGDEDGSLLLMPDW